MPRGPTNQELWDSLKNATGCGEGCLTLIVVFLLLIGLIAIVLK